MNNTIQAVMKISSLTVFFFIAGTTFSSTHEGIKIDLVASDRSKIVNVNLVEKTSTYYIQGKIRNKRVGRNIQIPGKIKISVISAEGTVLSSINTLIRKITSKEVHRRNANSRYASFKYELKDKPATGSTIRIEHTR